MKYYRFPETKLTKAALGLLLLALLLLCRDSMFTTALVGVNQSQFLVLGLVCVVGLVFLAVNHREWKSILTDGRILVIGISTLVMLLPMAVKRDWQMMYLSVLLCIYISVFFSYFISGRELAKYYVVIITVLGVYSVLATYFLRIPVDEKLISMPIFRNAAKHKFYNFGLAVVSRSFVKNRNFGIFREPGVYQYFILLALVMNNYYIRWKNERTMWLVNAVLAVTMLTTLATGGVAEMLLLAAVVFFDRKLYKDKRIVAAVAVTGVLAAIAIAVIVAQQGELYRELYSMVIDKFKPGQESGSDRFMSIVNNTVFFLKNPVFGEKFSTVLHVMDNNTSSSTILFAVYGILGGVLHAMSWVALAWEKDRKLWVNLALLVILFMSFNTQNLITDLFLWLFPMMALAERAVPMLKKRG